MKWTSDKATLEIEGQVANRAIAIAKKAGVKLSKIDIMMDIDACHNNGCPLKFQELLEADDFNFSHDVIGIRNHIDRRTGQLGDCFVPRYSA